MTIKKIGEVTEKAIKNLFIASDNYLLYKISKDWNEIVGTEMSTMLMIQSINKQGNIVLRLSNHCSATDAHMYKKMIKERIDTYFGKNIIKEIIITT